MRDENPPARARAARRLVELAEPSLRWNGPPEETPAPDPRAVNALALLILEDPDALVFDDAAASLNARDRLPTSLVLSGVDHEDDFRRAFAYREWGRRSRTAADLIARSKRAARALIEDKSPVARAAACSAVRCPQQLWMFSGTDVALQEEDWRRLRAQAFEVWPELVRELSDAPEEWARSEAAEILSEWDIHEPEVIAALEERSEHEPDEDALKAVKSALRRLKATRAPLFQAWGKDRRLLRLCPHGLAQARAQGTQGPLSRPAGAELLRRFQQPCPSASSADHRDPWTWLGRKGDWRAVRLV